MEKNEILEFLASNPDVLIDIVGDILKRYHDMIDQLGNTDSKKQLVEISKTIDRLESLDIPIPEGLRALKSSLLTGSNESVQVQNNLEILISGLNDLCHVYRRNVNPRPKSKRTVNALKTADSADAKKYFNVDTYAVHTNRLDDYSFTKLCFVKIADNEPFEIRIWRRLKEYVYNFVIRSNPSLNLTRALRCSMDPKQFIYPVKLENGYYIEVKLSATNTVEHCLRAIEAAGFDPVNDIVIGYTFTEKRKHI